MIAKAKQALVQNYHKITAGNLVRNRIIDSYKRQLLREEKTIEKIQEEITDLKELRILTNYWLNVEQKSEFWLRLSILRQFEDECASGTYEACRQ